MSTQRDRDKKKREEKLEAVQEQIDSGSLVIRKMTDAERKANPPKPRPPKKQYRR